MQSEKSSKEQSGLERWILPDGNSIPVYSSINHLHVRTKAESKEILGEDQDVNLGSEKAAIVGSGSLNLMTDEEIPPRGEISEYEESNTSLVSEDSVSFKHSKIASTILF
jgi:hypothetical protein